MPLAEDAARIIVLDSGGSTIKAGFAGGYEPVVCSPNCVGVSRVTKTHRQTFQCGEECFLSSEYFCHRPSPNGIMIDPELQRNIWERVLFGNKCFNTANSSTVNVAITEPHLTPSPVRHVISEIVFEDFGFNKLLICPAQTVIPYAFLCYNALDERKNNEDCSKQLLLNNPKYDKVPLVLYAGPSHDPPNDNRIGFITGSEFRNTIEENSNEKKNIGIFESGEENNLDFINPCSLSLDLGFNSSYCMGYCDMSPIELVCLRSNLGGTHMNSYMKNLCKLRHVNLENNELLVQHMKEECCFVSQDFDEEMDVLRNEKKNVVELGNYFQDHLSYRYILPDYNVKNKQILQDFFKKRREWPVVPETSPLYRFAALPHRNPFTEKEQQNESPDLTSECVVLCNERISVPEILFSPEDVGMNTCGIADLVYRTICRAPRELQPYFSRKIFLAGGNSCFPGLKERLWKELRSKLPQTWEIKLYHQAKPENTVWFGASVWCAAGTNFDSFATSKHEYFEKGPSSNPAK